MSAPLFPLRLTLWEELFVVDDHDNYPANFMTRLRGVGLLPKELFVEALKNCAAIHPLFNCQVRGSGRKLYWEPIDDQVMPVEYTTTVANPDIPLMRKFDVYDGRLWRIVVAQWKDNAGQEYTDLFVEFHHALCDGLGAIQFISDVAREIHAIHHQSQTSPEENKNQEDVAVAKNSHGALQKTDTDVTTLRNRGRFPQKWSEFFRNLPFYYKSILASCRLIFTKVAPMVPVESVREMLDEPKEFLGYWKIVFTSTESSWLRRVCRKKNTTVNSLVTAELFRAISDWKKEKGHPRFSALRIMIPFNERNLKDSRLPSCNRVSLSPFTRSAKEIESKEKLLSSIENGVRMVKKRRLGVNFHRGLWICKTFFRTLRWLAPTNRVGTTGVFANVGNIHALLGLPVAKNGVMCGPLNVVDIDLIPTIRIGTSFSMTMHEFDGESRLGIHYDSTLMTVEDVESFFAYFKTRILDYCQSK